MLKRIFGILLVLSVTLNVGLIVFQLTHNKQASTAESDQYPFISKRLFVENQNDILLNFVQLRRELRVLYESSPYQMGMYFEYLPSGVSIGINEKDNYVLASLLKVPIAMAVYKEVELGNLSLDKTLTITEADIDKLYGTVWQRGVGTNLSVRETLTLMLTESDNTAKNMLVRQFPLERLVEVFDYLDIPKESEESGPVVTPKNYSSVLRSLYLGSYLSKSNSNEILKTLTKSTAKDQLAAGVDSNVLVAHKIGVHKIGENNPTEVYTDCGIVYIPLRPYILCLMIKSDKTVANQTMKEISKLVFNYVKAANK